MSTRTEKLSLKKLRLVSFVTLSPEKCLSCKGGIQVVTTIQGEIGISGCITDC